MLRKKLKQYILRRPYLVNIFKNIFSNRLLFDNTLYQRAIINRAKRCARKYPYGEIRIAIETVLNCNSKCIMCYHGYKKMSGIMNIDLFKKIIDDCHANHINYVNLSVYGEPLTDPYLFERISYLRKYDMGYGFFTNGYLLDPEKAKMLFKLGGLKKINFSVCGYNSRVYEAIMVDLKRDITYKNIIDFLHLKENYKQRDLVVSISTVKLPLNKEEMVEFIKFWQRQMGVDRVVTGDLWDRLGEENVNKIGEAGKLHKHKMWPTPCKQLWGCLYIYFDGRVSPCCDDNDLRQLIIGDVNKQNLKQVFTGEYIENLRKQHLENKRSSHPICEKCFHESVWL